MNLNATNSAQRQSMSLLARVSGGNSHCLCISKRMLLSGSQQAAPSFGRLFTSFAAIGCLVSALVGCAAQPAANSVDSAARLAPTAAASQPAKTRKVVGPEKSQQPMVESSRGGEIFQVGTGQVVRPAIPSATAAGADDRIVSLNFENGDIREIAKNILGDLLQENFIIDPRVTGTISVRTPKGIKRSDLVPTFESLLRNVNAALVKDGNLWRVIPAAEAVPGLVTPRLMAVNGNGLTVHILLVRNIGAKELQRVMLPFAKGGDAAVRVDELRNLLFLTGTEQEVKHLIEISTMFDIDLMAGMSFLLYPLQNSEAKLVVADWEKLFPQGANPYAGLLRIAAIERMNALLLVSPRANIITQAREIVDRLDKRADGGSQPQLFVHFLQNTQAAKIQPILQQALSGNRAQTSTATVAPGQTPVNLTAPISPIPGASNSLPGNISQAPSTVQPTTPRASPATTPAGAGGGLTLARNAIIVADPDRNALLITATSAEFTAIESIIKKLDVLPKQIAIEVQIAQVTLKDDFQFGLQSFFQGKILDSQNRLTAANGTGSVTGAGFTYIWKKTDAIKAILNMSESKNNVRTLAQPTMITLDNQKVTFTSGVSTSVKTQTQSSNGTVGAQDSFQYIETGISLTVTPRVSGENVFLEIQQQISDPRVNPNGNGNPDVSKSSTSTSVMVQSGDTMLLGGLFQGSSGNSSDGLPLLSSIPIVGGLFGAQGWNSNRTELALLITPRIISDNDESREIVDELRKKLKGIEINLPAVGTQQLPSSAIDRKALKTGMGVEATDGGVSADQGPRFDSATPKK